MSRSRDLFAAVHSEGSMLPPDLLQRIMDRDKSLPGLTAGDYHHAGERLNEHIAASWQRLQGRWLAFKDERAKLGGDDLGTTETRERWLLPLFHELGYGRLQTVRAIEVDGRTYPVSHAWGIDGNVPIHLVGCGVEMDAKKAGVAGAARNSPHSLVQELLNRSDEHLWGFVSNGLRLRILRDNVSLSRQAYVEFDVEAMLEGELYSDFVLLWLLCHQSRVEGDKPEECWLERWLREAQQQGVRALDGLRTGVENAIRALGSGFLKQAGNQVLLDKLRDGGLDKHDYYRQLLRMVYRLLFLFTAEDRGLLVDPDASDAAAQTYVAYYSTDRLRRLAECRRGSRHTDLYESLRLVMHKLGSDGCPELGLPALGSFLFADASVADLLGCRLANRDLLEAVRHLAFTSDDRSLRAIDFRNLGAEELGSVYESLLEMTPVLEREAAKFELSVVSGSERKTTGSYYTPSSLIQCLLETALDPIVDERLDATKGVQGVEERREAAQEELLNLKICDPACGSGHFLIAAAHRLARRLAAVRTGDEEPAPESTRLALRDVIGHCIYGVDINPMSVELCKVNLWMEALEPGKPLSFLDHRIQCGNSLLGATPALLRGGIPDDAFKPIEGDDKKVCSELRKQNKKGRAGQTSLFGRSHEPWQRLDGVAHDVLTVDEIDDSTLVGIREKQARYERVVGSGDYQYGKLLADAWCAAFVWPKTSDSAYQVTEEIFRKMEDDPQSVPVWLPERIHELAERYKFFHWHVQYPDVFRVPATGQIAENEQAGWDGGFDVVLGNPPWERVKIQEKEWFAARGRDDIVDAPNAAKRKKMIGALADSDKPADRQLFAELKVDQRQADGESLLLTASTRYPLCGRGDVNTYAVFAELMRSLSSFGGRVGCILPSGILTDLTTAQFAQSVVECQQLVSFFDFSNQAELFAGVQGNMKFCLLTLGCTTGGTFLAAGQLTTLADLREGGREYRLSPSDISAIHPNTRTFAVFRSNIDARLVTDIHRRVPVAIDRSGSVPKNPWGLELSTMFHMANDSGLFRVEEDFQGSEGVLQGSVLELKGRTYVPLYEAKLISAYNSRAATFAGVPSSRRFRMRAGANPVDSVVLRDPGFAPLPRYWVPEDEVKRRLPADAQWVVAFRNAISAVADSRSLVATVLPAWGAGHSLQLIAVAGDAVNACCLLGMLNSFVVDYVMRQKTSGGNLSFYSFEQLPLLAPDVLASARGGTAVHWIADRVVPLVYTWRELHAFALAAGVDAPPFEWDELRRFELRCQLDAAFFHLFGLARDEVAHVMDSFPVLARAEQHAVGEFRSKRRILELYDVGSVWN